MYIESSIDFNNSEMRIMRDIKKLPLAKYQYFLLLFLVIDLPILIALLAKEIQTEFK
jgi:hypothetical protein